MLAPHHVDLIKRSAITQEVATKRGYRTVVTKAELKRLGFGNAQLIVPTFLIPIRDVHREIRLYQARPDEPRIRNGKPVKYETQLGKGMVLDVPLDSLPMLGEPDVPLFITEGARKADSAVSNGLCCIAVLGVWNFRGRNDLNGLTALGDWELIHLNGRRVLIVFDSDVMFKPSVCAAMARLGAFLESRHAEVWYVYLPSGAHGAKVGLDDFFAQGGEKDELLRLASREIRKPANEQTSQVEYEATANGLVWNKLDVNGTTPVQLTNFTAQIIAGVLEDDGVDQRSLFEIEAQIRGQPRRFSIPAAQFMAMNWAPERLGPTAILEPGQGIKERARVAIQKLSTDVEERHVFTHMGWREIDGQYVYLHADGGIGAEGSIPNVSVSMTGSLAKYRLPDPPDRVETVQSVRTSLALLEWLPIEISAVLAAAVYLAPLREFLGDHVLDFVIWLHGPSGTFKTEVSALAQGHFGDFSRTNLPASFTATGNALERLSFLSKDALLTVDDFHPAHDPREAAAMANAASRLLRGIGNASGRGRMRADTTSRPDYPPRCLALATGERLPEGHSSNARMYAVAIQPNVVDPALLSNAQAARGAYPVAFAAYVQWLAAHADQLSEQLPVRFRVLRDRYQLESAHRRAAGQIAHLVLGFETVARFAVEVGAIEDSVARDLAARSIEVFKHHARHQSTELAEETPANLTMSFLRNGFAAKRIYLETKHGEVPDHADQWGWESAQGSDGEVIWRHRPGATLAGALDDDFILFWPPEMYRFLMEHARASGRTFPVDQTTLWRRLAEAGICVKGTDRNLASVRFPSGDTRRVLKIPTALLSSASADDNSGVSDESAAKGSNYDSGRPDFTAQVSDVAEVSTRPILKAEPREEEIVEWSVPISRR